MLYRLFILFLIVMNSPWLHAHIKNDSSKVLLISLDGAADWILDDLLAKGSLSKNGLFEQIRKKGMYAKEVHSAPVAATAVSHASIFTGTYPRTNGIVGNRFLEYDKPMNGSGVSSGFTASIKTKYLWEHLMDKKKKVVLVNSVGADGTTASRQGSKTISYGKKLANSVHIQLMGTPDLGNPTNGSSFLRLTPKNENSPFAFQILGGKAKIRLFAFVKQEKSNKRERDQKICIDLDNNPENGYLGVLEIGKWTPLYLTVNGQSVVSWSYLKSWDEIEKNGTFYFGALGFNPVSPESYKKKIEDNIGIWPGEQDNKMLSQGLITESMWLQQAERLAYFYKDLILYNIKQGNWDLLTGYFQLIDDVQHRFLLEDPRQLDFNMEDGERKKRYDSYILWAYRLVDDLLLELQNALPKNVNMIVVSDHGIAPVHSIFLINNFLKEAGFNVDGENIEVKAYNTGPAAHIYFNVQNRQQNGVIPLNELQANKREIIGMLKKIKDPISGKSIFKVLLPSEKLKTHNLNYQGRSGDIFVSAKSGWSLSSKINPKIPYIIPNTFNPDDNKGLSIPVKEFLKGGFMNETGLGVHGNLGSSRKMHSIYYAIGPDIPKKKIRKMSIVDITPTIMDLMMVPKKSFDGISILTGKDQTKL